MKRSSVYWLLPSVDDLHHRRANILDDIGYQVFFFENIDALLKEIAIKRAHIIILGDEWLGPEGLSYARIFANNPDISAARLLISNSKNDYELMEAAMNEGFRDIIPADLDDPEWLQRFEFATSGVESILNQHSKLSSLAEPIELTVPARIVWVSDRQMWIETRSCPKVGDQLFLKGGFSQSLGLPELSVTILQKQQTNLTFRFSEAIIANWYQDAVLQGEPQKIIDTLDELHAVDLGQRPKIFLAIQSPALRTTLLRYIDRRKYEVHTALQKNSLLYEPKYFSPDLVFIEDRLMHGEAKRSFYELLRYLPAHTAIVSVGQKNEEPGQRPNANTRKMRSLRHIPINLGELIDRDYLADIATTKPASNEKTAAFPPPEHSFSFAQIKLSAELIQADYLQYDIRSQARIGSYSLIRIDSPRLLQELGGPVYLKVIESPDQAVGGDFVCKAHICNLTASLRLKDSKSESA